MNIKSKNNLKKTTVNFFGMIGYFFCSLQWFWAVLLYFSLILDVSQFVISNANNQIVDEAIDIAPVAASASPSVFTVIITIVIVIIMSALTIYILYKIPSVMAKTSEKVVYKTANQIAPVILQVQHKKYNEKNKLKLTPKIILVMKFALIIIPVVATFASKTLEYQLIGCDTAIFIGLWLAGISLVLFSLQYLVGMLLHVKAKDLV